MIILKAHSYSQRWFPDGPNFWGSQRILYTLIRGALGIILLSDVSFTTTFANANVGLRFRISSQSGLHNSYTLGWSNMISKI